jgi:2-isopropylmalate synthase
VDAVLRAMERATDTTLQLTRFQVQAVGEGGDAQGEARLAAQHDGRAWNGHGVSTDIVEAAAQAALAIVNRIAQHHQHATPTPSPRNTKAQGAPA